MKTKEDQLNISSNAYFLENIIYVLIIILCVYVIIYFAFDLHMIVILSFPGRIQKLRLSTVSVTEGQ